MDAQYTGRFWHRLPWPGGRAFGRAILVEVGTVAALLAALLAIVAGLAAWGAAAWLVILPLPVLAGALRRPQHGWLLALEFSLALRVVERAYATWGPPAAGPIEPPLTAFIEALLIAPFFWALVTLGRAFGEFVVRDFHRPHGPRATA